MDNFFQEKDRKIDLKIIKSDGGFATCDSLKPSQILLSGPAGGLIGYSTLVGIF